MAAPGGVRSGVEVEREGGALLDKAPSLAVAKPAK